MRGWGLFFPRRRIRTRIVLAVLTAMTLVLLLAAALVFWRVRFALDRQLDENLRTTTADARAALVSGAPLPGAGRMQVFSTDGRLLDSSFDGGALLSPAQVRSSARQNPSVVLDLGWVLPVSAESQRLMLSVVDGVDGRRVILAALDRSGRDEALRELLLQLLLTDLLAVAVAGLVGYGVTRAALDPVESYRRAAAAGDRPRLPVVAGRDDELSRLGHTLNSLLERTERSQERERRYLADASHELRSPLALLAVEIEWARHRPRSSEQMAEVLGSLGGQVQRLVTLANILLDLEELQGTEAMVRREPVRLDALVTDAVTGLGPTEDRTVDVTAPAALVQVDARWMGLAISNLVTNALRHGAGDVAVVARLEGGQLSVVVHDEGGGVPIELGERAFDRFTRGDAGRSTTGHGLGLALVRGVAQAHGGEVLLAPGSVGFRVRPE